MIVPSFTAPLMVQQTAPTVTAQPLPTISPTVGLVGTSAPIVPIFQPTPAPAPFAQPAPAPSTYGGCGCGGAPGPAAPVASSSETSAGIDTSDTLGALANAPGAGAAGLGAGGFVTRDDVIQGDPINVIGNPAPLFLALRRLGSVMGGP